MLNTTHSQNHNEIKSTWALSCGRFCGIGEDPDIFTSFSGIKIDVNLGFINQDTVVPSEISIDDIKKQLETHIKESLSEAPVLLEFLPKLMPKLHAEFEINDEFIQNVALLNQNGEVPTYYLCDHKH